MAGSNRTGAVAGGGTVYDLGLIGACIYVWQQPGTLAGHLLASLEGLVWPAFVTYRALAVLHV